MQNIKIAKMFLVLALQKKKKKKKKKNDHSMESSQCQEDKEAIDFYLQSMWLAWHRMTIYFLKFYKLSLTQISYIMPTSCLGHQHVVPSRMPYVLTRYHLSPQTLGQLSWELNYCPRLVAFEFYD